LDISLKDLESAPPDGAKYEPAGAAASVPKNYSSWEKELSQELAATQRLKIFRCPDLKIASEPDETEAEFKAKIALAGREKRDAEVEGLRKKAAPKLAALQARLVRAEGTVERQKEQASHARLNTFISVGSSILGALMGRKALSSANIGRAATAARGVSRTMKEGSDVTTAEQSLEAIRQQIADLETEIEAEAAALKATDLVIETVEVKPSRTGTTIRFVALAWKPDQN
jgi:hypothetical protein